MVAGQALASGADDPGGKLPAFARGRDLREALERGGGPQPLKVGPDGRLLIPLDMRKAIALGDDGRVTARVEAGELRLVTPTVAVQ